jgi:hypothetical protein
MAYIYCSKKINQLYPCATHAASSTHFSSSPLSMHGASFWRNSSVLLFSGIYDESIINFLFYPSIKFAIGSKISVSEHILLNKFSFADHEILPPMVLLSSILTASSCTKYLGSLILFISAL